jgi:hypothetical protein
LGIIAPKTRRSDCWTKKVSTVLRKIQRPKRSSERAAAESHVRRLPKPGSAAWLNAMRSSAPLIPPATSAQTLGSNHAHATMTASAAACAPISTTTSARRRRLRLALKSFVELKPAIRAVAPAMGMIRARRASS